MATLKSLLQDRLEFIAREEENLEQGKIWVYTPGTVRTNFHTGFCWIAPADGTAVIEIWGAGGSGVKMCCCGFGLPGNPGAYAKKTITVSAGCFVRGSVGMSCGNSDALCFRGCSEASCVCWTGNTGSDGCMCAQGGRGGTSYCSTGTSAYCCFTAGSFCTTKTSNENCGIVCNYGPGAPSCCADAFGGDINKRGGFSRASFFGCSPMCPCCFIYHVATPPGYHSLEGGEVTYAADSDNGFTNWSGGAGLQFLHTVGLMGRMPNQGIPNETSCWTGGRACGCYNGQGCAVFMPAGHPGPGPHPCPGVRDHAWRGGHGAVRIKFIESE